MAEKDYAKAGEVAHGIKGMTGNLSLTKLFDVSTTLMNELRAGTRNEETIADYRDAYEKTLMHVKALVEEL